MVLAAASLMSATGYRLGYAVTVEDPDHWTPEHRAQAEADPDGCHYGDWVIGQLDAAMRAAGEQFIREHPDLFAVNELT